MKLRIISEIFDSQSMDGIEKSAGYGEFTNGKQYKYEKLIDGDEYIVYLSEEDIDELPSAFTEWGKASRINMIEDLGGVWGVGLKGPRGYRSTNKGNFADVYNFLLSAISDAILEHDINILAFSGAEAGMDIIYNRFIKTFKKRNNPAFNFVKVGEDIYMSERGLENVDEELRTYLEIDRKKHELRNNEELRKTRFGKINKRFAEFIKKKVLYDGTPYYIASKNYDGIGLIGHELDGDYPDFDKPKIFNPKMIETFQLINDDDL